MTIALILIGLAVITVTLAGIISELRAGGRM